MTIYIYICIYERYALELIVVCLKTECSFPYTINFHFIQIAYEAYLLNPHININIINN